MPCYVTIQRQTVGPPQGTGAIARCHASMMCRVQGRGRGDGAMYRTVIAPESSLSAPVTFLSSTLRTLHSAIE